MMCQLCDGIDLRKFLDLGYHPPPLVLRSAEQLNEPETRYPLSAFWCTKCSLVQLGFTVDPALLFIDYTYTSGASKTFAKHLHDLSQLMIDRFQIGPNELVVDIGSNDGTSIEKYLAHGIRALGVEPSKIARVATQKGIPTVNAFFEEAVAHTILAENGKASLISAFNVFAHVAALDSLMKGVNLLLKDSGVFLTESHYLLDLIEKCEYDAIYHEHLRYYSLHVLMRLFEKYGFEVFDAERIPTHGGSIRVYAAKKGIRKVSDNIMKILQVENAAGLERYETYVAFADRVAENRVKLNSLLWKLKSEGKRIVGISAPARSSTVMNYCRIGNEVLDYVAETSPLKIGRFTPGTYIPIVSESEIYNDQPDYALLLSWHLASDLVPKIRTGGYRGKIILPLPDVQIL